MGDGHVGAFRPRSNREPRGSGALPSEPPRTPARASTFRPPDSRGAGDPAHALRSGRVSHRRSSPRARRRPEPLMVTGDPGVGARSPRPSPSHGPRPPSRSSRRDRASVAVEPDRHAGRVGAEGKRSRPGGPKTAVPLPSRIETLGENLFLTRGRGPVPVQIGATISSGEPPRMVVRGAGRKPPSHLPEGARGCTCGKSATARSSVPPR